jgi:hypothetical protein
MQLNYISWNVEIDIMKDKITLVNLKFNAYEVEKGSSIC